MGVLNVTPDSFSDGGRWADPTAAIARAEVMLAEGADILDIGGESTRPGSDPVPAEEETRRILPVIRAAVLLGAVVSVDTSKAEVARAALEAGAHAVNDVTAMADPHMPEVVAETGAGLVLMHMKGTPLTMQNAPKYTDAVSEVTGFLKERRDYAENRGVARERIALDPGIGFGKTVEHNLALLNGIPALADLGCAVLVGASRKRLILHVTGEEDPLRRLPGSLALAVLARAGGAHIHRVHNVAASRQALEMADAVLGYSPIEGTLRR